MPISFQEIEINATILVSAVLLMQLNVKGWLADAIGKLFQQKGWSTSTFWSSFTAYSSLYLLLEDEIFAIRFATYWWLVGFTLSLY